MKLKVDNNNYLSIDIVQVKHVLGILSVNSFVVHDGAEDGMDLIGKEYSVTV